MSLASNTLDTVESQLEQATNIDIQQRLYVVPRESVYDTIYTHEVGSLIAVVERIFS